jgi:predicted nucleic acid-binding protein
LAGYFFDTSAPVKLDHDEAGTDAVQQIVAVDGNLVRISRLAVAEFTSAFAIKVRTRAITREDAGQLLHQFREDIVTGKLEVFSVADAEYSAAERYGFDFRLCTLDAVQLAVALELRGRGLADYFVTADAVLHDVAVAEGFAAINPGL